MKRVALYIRVSTGDQHPETQLCDLRQMARQRGLEIVAEYTDKISGTKAKRLGFDRLLADAHRGKFDVVMVWAFDRVARSVRHFLEVLDELNHHSIEFVSFRENVDTGGPLAAPPCRCTERDRNSKRAVSARPIKIRYASDHRRYSCIGSTSSIWYF